MKALSQPLFASLRGYDRAQLGPDLFSGALIALLSIPISMGYAQLAGLPPVYGLYGSLIPILLFAMLSTTREFIFGVDAAPAAMIGAVLASLGVTAGSAEAMRIVPVLTLYVALWLAVFALVRADKAVDYISEPVMGGFISGVCCEIILMQVPKLLGSATGTGELFELLGHVFDAAKVINWPTAALGFGTLAILLIAPRKWQKVPWVLVMMVLGGLLGAFAPLDDWGVALLAAVLWLLRRRCGLRACLWFAASQLLVTVFWVPHQVQYFTCFALGYAGCVWVLAKPRRSDALCLALLVLGVATAFCDLLVTPILTLGLPLVCWLLEPQRTYKHCNR